MEFKASFRQSKEDAADPVNLHRITELHVRDDLPDIKVQLPVTYNGLKNDDGNEKFYTPEHLFLGAVAGCFFTTFSVVSTNSKFKYADMQIEATGVVDVVGDVKMMATIAQTITLTLPVGSNGKKAKKILEITDARCPLANSVKTQISNTYIIKILE